MTVQYSRYYVISPSSITEYKRSWIANGLSLINAFPHPAVHEIAARSQEVLSFEELLRAQHCCNMDENSHFTPILGPGSSH